MTLFRKWRTIISIVALVGLVFVAATYRRSSENQFLDKNAKLSDLHLQKFSRKTGNSEILKCEIARTAHEYNITPVVGSKVSLPIDYDSLFYLADMQSVIQEATVGVMDLKYY
jgi:FtsZ-interacting cell division protein ZipA